MLPTIESCFIANLRACISTPISNLLEKPYYPVPAYWTECAKIHRRYGRRNITSGCCVRESRIVSMGSGVTLRNTLSIESCMQMAHCNVGNFANRALCNIVSYSYSFQLFRFPLPLLLNFHHPILLSSRHLGSQNNSLSFSLSSTNRVDAQYFHRNIKMIETNRAFSFRSQQSREFRTRTNFFGHAYGPERSGAWNQRSYSALCPPAGSRPACPRV